MKNHDEGRKTSGVASSETVSLKDEKAHELFNRKAVSMGLDPHSMWVGGYVEYEWNHVRHFVETVIGNEKSHILEFGCNFGATSVVTALLGHVVCAVDISQDMIELAELNAAQYGVASEIKYSQITADTRLPYDDESFDAVLCNSVLEYVSHKNLKTALKEIDRVLKPGGLLLVLGTSNRLSPKEVHSGKWFVNYIPEFCDHIFFQGKHPERGLNPFKFMNILGNYRNLDIDKYGKNYFEIKELSGISGLKLRILKSLNFFVRPFGISVGLLTPSFSVNLQKPF